MAPVLANLDVESQLLGQVSCLMVFPTFAFDADHFLQRDNVRVDVAQDAQNSVRTYAPIQAPALMDIVSSHTQALGM